MRKMNKITKIILWVIIVLVIIGGIWYGANKKQTQIPVSQTPIKIGAILPLTGKYSFIGEYLKEGAELAKDEINSNNRIDGTKLEIIYEDSQADTKLALSSYKKLSEFDDVNIFLTTISGVTLGIAPLAEENKNLVFSIGTASTKISNAGDYIFRHNLLPRTEAKVLAKFIHDKMNIEEVGMLFVNADSGISYRDAFEESFEKIGGEIKIIESHEKGTGDYRTQLMKIKSSGVNAIAAFSYSNELALALKQAQELGLNVQWFSIYDAESPKLLEVARDSANGLIYTHYFDSDFRSLIAEKYNENYRQKYNRDSESYAALMYDSVKVLSRAIENCRESVNPTCMKDELYQIKDFHGVTGNISFNVKGDTEKQIIIKTIKNGEFISYKEE